MEKCFYFQMAKKKKALVDEKMEKIQYHLIALNDKYHNTPNINVKNELINLMEGAYLCHAFIANNYKNFISNYTNNNFGICFQWIRQKYEEYATQVEYNLNNLKTKFKNFFDVLDTELNTEYQTEARHHFRNKIFEELMRKVWHPSRMDLWKFQLDLDE